MYPLKVANHIRVILFPCDGREAKEVTPVTEGNAARPGDPSAKPRALKPLGDSVETSGEPAIDLVELGTRLRAARILARVEVQELVSLLSTFGIRTSTRALYTYERGEVAPPLEVLVTLVHLLNPEGGWVFMAPAIRPDIMNLYRSPRKLRLAGLPEAVDGG